MVFQVLELFYFQLVVQSGRVNKVNQNTGVEQLLHLPNVERRFRQSWLFLLFLFFGLHLLGFFHRGRFLNDVASVDVKARPCLFAVKLFYVSLSVLGVGARLEQDALHFLLESVHVLYAILVELFPLVDILGFEVLVLGQTVRVELVAELFGQVLACLESVDIGHNGARLAVEVTDEVYLLTGLQHLHALNRCFAVQVLAVVQNQQQLRGQQTYQDNHEVVLVCFGPL